MNDQRRQGRIARRGGCRWLGFTFGLRTGGCLKRGKRAKERERERVRERERSWGDEGRRVLRWDIGEWFHACIPRIPWAAKERCARDPSGIIEYHLPLCSFLSLFFSARRWVQTRVSVTLLCMRAWLQTRVCSQYANGETEKERYGDKRAHTFVLVMRYTPMAAGPLYFLPIGTLHPGLYATRAYVFHPRALCYFFDSRGKPRPPTARGVKELWKRFRCPPARTRLTPWHIAVFDACTRRSWYNLSSIQMRNDVT